MVGFGNDAAVAGALVRVWNGPDVVGGGFLVGSELVATCAHVVADATGADPYSRSAPADPVSLDLPLLPGAGRVEAVVERWSPIADDGTGDVAVLRLTRPAPPQARMPPLRRIDRLWDHGFRVLGFPEGRPDGVWSSGLIRGEQSTRWFQLQSTAGEQRIEGGFSGCPVWDEQSGAVVGMTVAADRGDTTTAYLIPIDQVLGLDPALLPCPYLGLRPFGEEHADTFFGRGEEIDKLVEAIGRTPVVAVAGPSGAGKSSLIRAGLLPRLRAAGTAVVDVGAGDDLEHDPTPGSVLVVDQFEERAAADPDGARRLLERVVRLTGTDSVRAVLTVRWAALDQVASPELLGVLESGTVLVAPMSRGRLREAIVGPAERSPGLAFEPGLVDRILDDAGAEPGQLPLVESLLTDLWDRREGGYLTLRGYEAAGGVAGAVAEHAERTLEAIGADAVDDLRGLFTALARPGHRGDARSDGGFVRQPIRLAELPPAQRDLVPALTDGRLLVVSRSERDGDSVVELAHQALIDHWPRLRTWLAEDHAFLDWRSRVDTQRAQWEADDKADTALLRGATLAEAVDWLPARAADLGPASADYLRLSRARQRWEVRRWRIVTAVLAVLGLAAATLSVVAVERRQVLAGQLAAANADAIGREALARMPADSALAAQLALAAWRSDPTSPQARTALATSFLALRSADTELLNLAPATVTGLTSAGDTVLVGGMPHLVALTGTSGPAPRRLELPDITSGGSVALSPDGRRLAYTSPDRTVIRLRDLTDAAEPTTLPSPPVTRGTVIGPPFFAPDGERLAWTTVDATNTVRMTVWDLRSDAEIPNGLGALAPEATAVWLTPDPNVVLMRYGTENSPETRLVQRSSVDGTELATMPAGAVVAGTRVVSCELGGDRPSTTVTVTRIGAAEPLRFSGLEMGLCKGWISADGRTLIEADPPRGPVRTMRLTDLDTGVMRYVDVPAGILDRPAVGLDGTSTVAVDWSSDRPSMLAAHGSSVFELETRPLLADTHTARWLSADGRYVVSDVDGSIVVEDPATGQRLGTAPDAQPVGGKVAFGSEAVVFAPEPFGWTLTSYDFPALRRAASYRLPASANPVATSTTQLGGQDVALDDAVTEQGRIYLSLSDGVLAALDPLTGRPLGPPITLGDSPEQRDWFQRFPVVSRRPGHHGQAVVVDAERHLQVWDAVRGTRLATIPTSYRSLVGGLTPPKFAVDLTGTRLAVLTPTSTVELWDIDSATLARPPIAVEDAGDLVGFDADGYLVVKGGDVKDGSLTFVDVTEGRTAGSLPVDAFSPDITADGSGLHLTGNRGQLPEMLPLTAPAWHDKLCSVLDRPFSDAELRILPPGTDARPPC